jgi:hypothetical protein
MALGTVAALGASNLARAPFDAAGVAGQSTARTPEAVAAIRRVSESGELSMLGGTHVEIVGAFPGGGGRIGRKGGPYSVVPPWMVTMAPSVAGLFLEHFL